MHLCAQEDAVNAATILAQAGALINEKTKVRRRRTFEI